MQIKKTISLFLILSGLLPYLFAQYNEMGITRYNTKQYDSSKSVLFLMSTDAENLAELQKPTLEDFRQSVIGFWCGAQIALDELAEEGYPVKVIVRDINADDEQKLDMLLADPEIQKTDMIIAVVTRNLFPKIAQFSDNHHIQVLNPFSVNSEIVVGHPCIYKLQPPLAARPVIVRNYFAGSNFIMWADSTSPSPDLKEFKRYFKEKHLPCHYITAPADFAPCLSSGKRNVVISGTDDPNDFISGIQALKKHSGCPEFSWIVPESIILNEDFDISLFQEMNIYFFSNNFVNPDSRENEIFIYRYFEKFNALPSLASFSYQGYDITKNFIGKLFLHSFDTPPLSYSFNMIRRENGGYENFAARLIQMKNLQYHIIEPD